MKQISKLMLFLYVIMLCINITYAAEISGTIYSMDLEPVGDVIVEVDTTPKQRLVSKQGQYTLNIPKGTYTITALYYENNQPYTAEENINITDWIPSIATHKKESHVGTLAPKKILKHLKRGTIIKWEIDALEPFEERIISYKLKSKIAIVGGLTLPHSKIKFETDKGQERTVTSNRSRINFGL